MLFGHDLHKLYYENGDENRRDVIYHLVIMIALNIQLLKPNEYELFFKYLQPYTRNGDNVII
jgi:hypothetical protein